MLYSLPVLMYHSISRFKHRLCVSPELFEDHCRVLREAGWRGISLAEAEGYFLENRRLPKKSCLFTFDDGYLDNFVHAEPILRHYGHQGVIFPIADSVETNDNLRPNRESPEQESLPDLDARKPVVNSLGYQVIPIIFCSWTELQHMREHGAMDCAPHSTSHSRVITSLEFSRLYTPTARHTHFDFSPYQAVWGMPRFRLGHGLSNRGYELAPELFDLVSSLVPQDRKQAHQFLADEGNRRALTEAIRKLPVLGVLESEEHYRKRIREDFHQCREIFRERLGHSPRSFCWPWGSYNRVCLDEARKAGFRVFFTTMRGINPPGSKGAVRRISVRGGTGQELLATVTGASDLLRELPFEAYRLARRTRAAYKRWKSGQ